MSRIRRSVQLLILALAFALPRPALAAELECSLLPQLFGNYFQVHYSMRKMNDTVRERTVTKFINNLDPSKTLFYEKDIAPLRAKLPAVFETMKKGDCDALEEVRKTLIERAEENEAFVKSFVDKSYKLDTTVELIIDPDKRGFPKTLEEKHTTLRNLIHFQISNYLMADMSLEDAKTNLIHRYELATKRLRERDNRDMVTTYAEAFASALDPHTAYLSHDRHQNFQIQMRLSLEGIGATLSSQDGFTVIEGIIAGGGAERSGMLRPKDKIIAVAQDGEKPTPVIDLELTDVVKMIRGKKGTKVTLTVLRQGETAETFDVTIVRDKIDVKEQAAKITYHERPLGERKLKLGVIELPSFYGYGGGRSGGRSSYRDVKRLLEEAKKAKVDGVVLDLSRNGGGLLDEAVRISGLFIKEGAVVTTRDTLGRAQVLSDDDGEVVYAGPLVLLVSRVSASASEILAGTLKAYGRAVVVGGEHTFGKGSVQTVIDLPSKMGAMTITMGMFFVADGQSTQQIGVTPDIRFPTPFDDAEFGEKSLDYSLPPQKIAAFISKKANVKSGGERWEPVTTAEIAALSEKSQARVEKAPEFAEIKRKLAENKDSKERIKLSELRKRSAAEKAKEKGEPKNGVVSQSDAMHDLVAPLINESVNILADMVAVSRG